MNIWRPAPIKSIRKLKFQIRRTIRKLKRLCQQCGRKLNFETCLICFGCQEAKAKYQKAYGRRSDVPRQWVKKARQKNPAKFASQRKKLYLQKKLAKICVKCSDDALEDSNFCQFHLKHNRKSSKKYQAKKRAANKAAKLAVIFKMAA